MKRISSTILCAILAGETLAGGMPRELLLSGKQTHILTKSGKTPNVELMAYNKTTVGVNGWGSGFSFGVDIEGSY